VSLGAIHLLELFQGANLGQALYQPAHEVALIGLPELKCGWPTFILPSSSPFSWRGFISYECATGRISFLGGDLVFEGCLRKIDLGRRVLPW
jgi:hypothetical protein